MDLKSRLDFGGGYMADKYKLHGKSKAIKEALYDNLILVIVLIFSFIYFLFQLYAWFIGFKGS